MRTLVTTILSAGLAIALQAEETPLNGALTLTVSDIGTNRGEVRIALFNSKKTYTKNPIHVAVVKVEKGSARWIVTDLKPGDYAIALFHDANGDGKMNKNLIGLPKEDYGFSNDASGTFGPPSWSKAKLTIGEGVTQHIINLKD